MKFKAISAFILLAAVQAISHAAPGASAPQPPTAGAVTGDPTGLIGKTVTYQSILKKDGSSDTSYGSDYFGCGARTHDDLGAGVGIGILRKGLKKSCGGPAGQKTIVLSRTNVDIKTEEFFDALEITVPNGYEFTSNCTGARMAISKRGEDGPEYTKHLKAWNVVNLKFTPVVNLKTVKCDNPGYGL